MNANEIRTRFINYFSKLDHEKIASSSLIPHNDPTLLFINAGMNQFKDNFTGASTPKTPRAVSIQKCVRAGGKHNDLENVGFTARHHTFFEMLGNFSFGDYFKKEAIFFAWEFLTEELKISKEKLVVTVHHSDDEAYNIWTQDLKIPENRIFRKGDKDNFWEMGEFGPCGPCSEIFFDHGKENGTPGYFETKEEPFDDGGRFIEIWNLVFMQFEKKPEGRFNLPKPSIDTGAGLERIVAALQGHYWNYDTDLFMPIIRNVESITKKSYSDKKYCGPMRVIADHIRSSTMLITDGVIPSNEGRGYVLRRIIRRAVRQLKELGAPKNSFYKLIPVVFETLGQEYSQNMANESLATKLLQIEEKQFLETLDHGLKFLNDAISKKTKNDTLPGSEIFKLYDTYGFPADLTEIILNEKNLKADIDGFHLAMEKRKEQSRKSWKGGELLNNDVFYKIKERYGVTNFVDQKLNSSSATLIAKEAFPEITALVFDSTPFYAESGGQAGDTGYIQEDGSILAVIDDTQKPVEGLHIHFSKNADALEVGQKYKLTINRQRRELIGRNHSATHLLQAALIKYLGNHIKQAGSNVTDSKIRFDFTHPEALTQQELQKVEAEVNYQISLGLNVSINLMNKDEAIRSGAQALFGEKYGDEVRVIKMDDFSTELCGGTHVSNTAEIDYFSILSEGALSSGVRRIEALSSATAINRLASRSNLMAKLELLTKVKDDNVVVRIENLIKENKKKQRQITALEEKLQSIQSEELFSNPTSIGNYLYKNAEAQIGSDLKKMSDIYMDKNSNGIILLYIKDSEKFSVLLRGPKNIKNFHLGNILKESLKLCNGRGGGKPIMGQGSGELKSIDSFLKNVEKLIHEIV